MDLSKIENIYSCTISDVNVTGRYSFSKVLYVPFQPDFVIVKNLQYSPFTTNGPGSDYELALDGKIYFITSGLVPEQFRTPLGHLSLYVPSIDSNDAFIFSAKTSQSPLIFKMDKNVIGTYTFKFSGAANAEIKLYGTISFNLEFVKIKK